ncbi:MAG: SRPBCC family protein [Proteiniphilum sp.]|jgi:hypothetical protein|uniref:SRPBCC family protein n=1 Tax=Proteiniphilum sp. TaxID=1926877 RepID=UPI002ABB9C07|nr:SRPBCC family protein [Proteiniphilum sp.]MDY9920045.1 SRPBCC family protein [Proteiniphilum sp.]
MAKEIRTEIIIRATSEKIWDILTDFENYPNWNPFITFIKGKVEEGSPEKTINGFHEMNKKLKELAEKE